MITLQVEGMSCGHCVRAVTEAIHTLDPKAGVQVDLKSGTVRAETGAAPEAIAAAVEEEGYKVVSGV
ncbi:heavy-metal-associated domain-containing protein [Belnapia sp. T6]|uniref:Heavy-metal-associated domain-containing protein n=1 Tax=Belnapia mucosa TaxID=2804532 RepID=A0ABS1V5Q7_9PROT|nr:cation transporter [Belnapia mucosa]MBL6456471.1 heavy-metal-associated domain-containing protein [Belnapia mucosa]